MLPRGPILIGFGNIPDLRVRGPEYYQWVLVIFRTSSAEVRNVTSSYW